LLIVTLASGCAPALDLRVRAAANPQAELTSLRTFALAQSPRRDAAGFDLTEHVQQRLQGEVDRPLSTSDGRYRLDNAATNPAGARFVASIAREQLTERGYRFNEADPDFTVSVDFVDGTYREYGYSGLRGVIRASSDQRIGVGAGAGPGGELDPYPQEDVRTVHARAVALYFYDVDDPDRLLWHGRAVTTRTDADLRILLPLLIEQVLGEFPHPSGRPEQRTVQPPAE